MPTNRFNTIRPTGTDGAQARQSDSIATAYNRVADAVSRTPILRGELPAWIHPSTLGADIVNVGGGAAVAAFHKDCLGYVHSRGVLQTAAGFAAGTVIWTFPLGMRPTELIYFSDQTAAGRSYYVAPSGAFVANTVLAAGGFLALAFSFLAEQ